MNEEIVKYMLNLYSSPLFKKGFFDFFMKMQEEGMPGAKKFWDMYPDKDKMPFDKAPELFEKMIDFYTLLGFVPRKKFDDVVKENEELKKENKVLRDLIAEMNLKVLSEGGAKAQELWKATIESQMEMGKEMSKNFLELFKKLGAKD